MERMEGSVMKGRLANLGRVLWNALQRGEVQSFILVFLSSLAPPASCPLSLHPSLPLFPSLSFLFVWLNLSNISLSPFHVFVKKG